MPHQAFHLTGHRRFIDEAHLDIELREFGLPVCAQILIPETAHDLVVAIEAGHHQQLFEYLRRLRQRKKLAWMRAARHDVVTRAFGRRARQHWRFDIDESVTIEKLAHRHSYFMAQTQVVKHAFAAQVEITVLQTQLFIGLFVVMKRRRLGTIQNHKFVRQHFDLPCLHVRVDRAFRTLANEALDRKHVLAANTLGLGEDVRPIGVKNHL